MSTEITIALIGIAGTIITSLGTLIGVIVTNRKANANMIHSVNLQQSVFEARVSEQIGTLTNEVRRHNSIIERTYKLETQQKVQGEKISSLENQVGELQRRRND